MINCYYSDKYSRVHLNMDKYTLYTYEEQFSLGYLLFRIRNIQLEVKLLFTEDMEINIKNR